MPNQSGNELEILSGKWNGALQSRDFDLALQIAVQGYSAARHAGDRVHLLMFLGFIRHAAETLFDQASTRKIEAGNAMDCSFCLKPKTNLVRGIGVAICTDCIEMAKSAV
jgi:hypothetical protein